MPDKLEEVFDFEESDIPLNQSGQLSEKQLAMLAEYRRIRRFGGRLAFGAFFISSVFLIGIWFYIVGFDYDPKKHFEMSLAFAAILSIMWLLFLLFFFLGIIRSDLKSRKISSVEGVAAKTQKKMPRRLGTAYFVSFDREKFQLDTKAKYQAVEPGKNYRVFYIKDPPAHIILSIAEI